MEAGARWTRLDTTCSLNLSKVTASYTHGLRADVLIAISIFVACFSLLWLADGRLLGPLDEGIYLDGATRMIQGQRIYRDFFALTGPGTFLLVSLLFRVFGAQLSYARLLPAFDIGVMAAGIYLLSVVWKKRNPWPGLAAVVCFVGLEVTKPGFMSVRHRLDSGALILWSVLIPVLRPTRRLSWFLSGVLAAAACWCTPSMGVVLIAGIGWLVVSGSYRHFLLWNALGCVVVSSLMSVWLLTTGAAQPFWTHMLWAAANYSGANRFGYGGLMGGYANPAYQSRPVLFALWLVTYTLPATLPLVVLIGSRRLLRFRGWPGASLTSYLMISAAACLASAWPRFEILHLTTVSPIFYALAVRLIATYDPPRNWLLLCTIPVAVLGIHSLQQTAGLDTVRGRVMGSDGDIAALRWTISRIPPHSTLFVYPYAPNLYFFTGARNPTRYSFLQPGMSNARDEASVTSVLRHTPPRYIVIQDLAPEAFLKIWPSTDPGKLRMRSIEDILTTRYVLVDAGARYKLYRYQGSAVAGAHDE